MSYLVKLDQFEGPLDLLLHLISKSKVRIEDISITEITEQYLGTLHRMKQFDVEIASEFLVMAATLLHIKSCILVPRSKPDPEEEEEADPKQELITRLLEYKKYKEAGSRLQEREAYFSGIFYKLPEEFYSDGGKEALPSDVDAELLCLTLLKLLSMKKGSAARRAGPLIHEIKRDPITINERMTQLREYFVHCSQTTFFQMFQNDNTKEEIIVTFLALLELLKENYIALQQEYPFEDIVIKRRVANG
jgi:segregation and condensation protein A